MSNPDNAYRRGPTPPITVTITAQRTAPRTTAAVEPATLCDRCDAEMYRMHAVWRCPACGFKTDCCGW